MSCHVFEADIVELARSGRAEEDQTLCEHLRHCPSCAARLADERALSAGLRALTGVVRDAPPAALEARLLSAFDEAQAAKAGGARDWRSWLATAAALAILASGLTAAWRGYQAWPPARVATSQASPDAEFVPWPGAATLPAFESGHLVRTELPASVLPLLGIATAASSKSTVLADVLVGQDGMARAVRVVAGN